MIRSRIYEREEISSNSKWGKVENMLAESGSVLSVTLFAIKINALADIIPSEMLASLFVDDLQVAYSNHSLNNINNKLQQTIDKISEWTTNNGFRVSISKTVCMTFYRNSKPALQPNLRINARKILIVESTKFLGVYWDERLKRNVHISQLKAKCKRTLNLMRTLYGQHWGADQESLMRVYRIIIRPKLDYGSAVYGSADKARLGSLETIQSDAIRIATGAFRTSRVECLRIIPPLQ